MMLSRIIERASERSGTGELKFMGHLKVPMGLWNACIAARIKDGIESACEVVFWQTGRYPCKCHRLDYFQQALTHTLSRFGCIMLITYLVCRWWLTSPGPRCINNSIAREEGVDLGPRFVHLYSLSRDLCICRGKRPEITAKRLPPKRDDPCLQCCSVGAFHDRRAVDIPVVLFLLR